MAAPRATRTWAPTALPNVANDRSANGKSPTITTSIMAWARPKAIQKPFQNTARRCDVVTFMNPPKVSAGDEYIGLAPFEKNAAWGGATIMQL